jgi:Transposase IS4
MADQNAVVSPRADAVNTQGLHSILYGIREANSSQDDDSFHSACASDDESQQDSAANKENMPTPVQGLAESPNPAAAEEEEDGRKEAVNDDDSDGSSMNDPPVKVIPNMNGTQKEVAMDAGYDSDGEGPPMNNTSLEEFQLEEDALGETPPMVAQLDNNNNNNEEEDEVPPNIPVDIPEDKLSKITIVQIKEQLAIRNVSYPSRLKRPELLQRLKDSLHLDVVAVAGSSKKKGAKNKKDKAKVDDMAEFAPGAYWKVLTPDEAAVAEPKNPGLLNARCPTLPSEDVNKAAVTKHNFSMKFDRPIFSGTKKVIKTLTDGITAMKDSEGKIIYEKVLRTDGHPRASFIRQHKLSPTSHPAEFLQAFLPMKNKEKNKNGINYLSIADLVQWTNLKAVLSNAGTNQCYKDFHSFTPKELKQHLGLYILNGLSPSPSLELKFDKDDVANFNIFVHTNIRNGVRRHRMFKAFFACQDPRKNAPPRRTSPLFKLVPLLNWMNRVGQLSWEPSMNLAIDEQTISFQGRHADKLRINYKAEGDGFQADAICDKGFTMAFYFRNEPPPKKYIKQGLSPLHARVVWLFDKLEEKHYRVWMDNLYISAKFAKFALNHPKKILIAGVARKSGRGIPMSVLQEDVKNVNEAFKVRGTVKAAVLMGDKDCENLVAVSVYDTKPVHFISTICESVEWITKERDVWNEAKQEFSKLKFLRLNVNDDYNNDMNAVDIADQLRNNYRFDHWLRNFKWWWAIFQWSLGVLIVNSYVVYCSVCDTAGILKKDRLTQYQFRLAIARLWIDLNEDAVMAQWKQQHKKDAAATATEDLPQTNKKNRKRSPLQDQQSENTQSAPLGSVEDYGSAAKARRLLSSDDAKSKSRSPQISDISLSSCGKMCCRLEFHSKRHLPMSPKAAGKPNAKCALHRWALGRESDVRSNILHCPDCCVSLCIDCYSVFHIEEDLIGKKEKLATMMEEDLKAKQELLKKKKSKVA